MRILIVEDDQALGEGIQMGLRQGGWQADWVQDGEAAGHALASEPFAALVLDLGLPKVSGLEVLRQLRARGLAFLDSPPHTYYEDVAQRVKGVRENLQELEELAILVDGSEKGYLLQIFSQNAVGPFFYEVIQRAGDDGFGEGNFRALFEAIERDQIRRGVLK